MKFFKIHRENGLIEIACEHGVGHPSKLMTPEKYYYGVHGCCGCCSLAGWGLAELKLDQDHTRKQVEV